ncbi:slit homolog 2 protein-like [Patiria miniata]|uniref:Uncharacterized protein n=1 Tax=Patiria miniata TaxID=46514 RepID=A0A913ZLT6_PATMI|nr:slit homolog 2 protein-like [Patiria miniata]
MAAKETTPISGKFQCVQFLYATRDFRNMARTWQVHLAESSLKYLVLSLLLSYVSSQSCTAPLPQTCTCNETFFVCRSANLTEFPSGLPNAVTLQNIDVSDNLIPSISSDVLGGYTQLGTLNLARNVLTSIAEQTVQANFTLDLSSNPIVCDTSLAWLAEKTVLGTCADGGEISAFIESLKSTAAAPVSGPTQSNTTIDAQTQPLTDAPSQSVMTSPIVGTTLEPEEPNRLYILAIIIPVLVIVVICIAIVIFTRKNRKQQEAYNSSIRYSVVRKDAGAGNRVYSDVTTEL